jgi:hypothetical protein
MCPRKCTAGLPIVHEHGVAPGACDFANLPVSPDPPKGEHVSEYVTIANADNEAIGDLIKQRLEQSGIPCLLVPSNMVVVAGAGASYAVTVPAERAGEARELLGE